MTNKLVVIINSLKVPKIKKILLYEMKFLVRNYSCLQNPWLGSYSPQIPVLFPQLNLLNPPPDQNSWVHHWSHWIARIIHFTIVYHCSVRISSKVRFQFFFFFFFLSHSCPLLIFFLLSSNKRWSLWPLSNNYTLRNKLSSNLVANVICLYCFF